MKRLTRFNVSGESPDRTEGFNKYNRNVLGALWEVYTGIRQGWRISVEPASSLPPRM